MENNEGSEIKQEPSDLDKAAYDVEYVMPKAIAIASNMKAGELARVFSMLLQYPIIKRPKRFKSKKETELFLMCLKIQSSKSKLMDGMKDQLEDAQEDAVNEMKNELVENMMERQKTDD